MEAKSQIRILQVFGKLNRGGAETLIMDIYREIDRSKLQFDFVVHTKEECVYEKEIKALGGEIYRVPRYEVNNHFQYRNAWKKLLISKSKYWHVVHGHMYTTASIYLSIAKEVGLVTIVHSHNTSYGIGLKAYVKKILKLSINKNAAYYMACSSKAGEWLYNSEILKSNKFHIFKNGIRPDNFIYNQEARKQKREEMNLEGKFVIGHIGRFHYQKNHSFLIEIFKAIHDLDNNARLVLVGDGALRKQIEKKVHEIGLSDHVIFTGVQTDIPDLLNAMDVFVFPSHFEGFGIVLVEAQATGIKCFTSAEVVSTEAKITSLLEFIPLNHSAKAWANHIIQYKYDYGRKSYTDEIKKSGYDITSNSRWLENFYLTISQPNTQLNEVS